MSSYVNEILGYIQSGKYKIDEIKPVVETDRYYRKIITTDVRTGKMEWFPLSQGEFRELRQRRVGLEGKLHAK